MTSWIPDTALDGEDGWHPLDALFVPLHASDGALLGTLSVDLPYDGRRPEDHELELLGMFGQQSAHALENARLHDSLVEQERALAAALSRTEAMLEAAPVAIIELDLQGRVTRWNQAAERMLGWTQSEVLGLLNPASAGSPDGVHVEDLVGGTNVDRVHLQRRTKDGRRIDVELSTAVVRDAHGEPLGVLGAMTDITERLQQEDLLRTAAFRDPLTGCANRARVMEVLGGRLGQGVPTALLLLDLDGFKQVNDSFGHGVGDEVIVEVARRLGTLEGPVTVGRLGGDEFVLVCADREVAARSPAPWCSTAPGPSPPPRAASGSAAASAWRSPSRTRPRRPGCSATPTSPSTPPRPRVGAAGAAGTSTWRRRRSPATPAPSPAPGPRPALERPDHPRGHPAAVEVALLRHHLLVTDPALVHPGRVERDVVGERLVPRRGRRVGPGGLDLEPGAGADVPVPGRPLVLAPGLPVGGDEGACGHVRAGDVVDGRVAGLEDAQGGPAVGDDHPAEHDPDLARVTGWTAGGRG